MTRDNLLSIASRFGLFPRRSGVLELMRESSQIKPVEVVGQSRSTHDRVYGRLRILKPGTCHESGQ